MLSNNLDPTARLRSFFKRPVLPSRKGGPIRKMLFIILKAIAFSLKVAVSTVIILKAAAFMRIRCRHASVCST